MQLSKRLQAVAAMVPAASRLADVGTDHAYVPIWLVRQGMIPSAIAMDVREGPLGRAAEHIRAAGLTDYIQTRLSDGLAELKNGEADCVLIAGMGGPLMRRILEQSREKWAGIRVFVFQPQSEVEEFRRFLDQAGFYITGEDMVEEDGKYYPMMSAVRGQGDYTKDVEFLFGKALLEARHPVLLDYLHREQDAYRRILDGLAGRKGSEARQEEIQHYLERIKEAAGYFEEQGDC